MAPIVRHRPHRPVRQQRLAGRTGNGACADQPIARRGHHRTTGGRRPNPVARAAGRPGGLRAHNLPTCKSGHEALGARALDELIGHCVNYRKLNGVPTVSADGSAAGSTGTGSRLPPEADFRLYAVATRHPEGLRRRTDCRATGSDGVFDLRRGLGARGWGPHDIRLIVLGDIAAEPRNARWELFRADIERVRHGARYYRTHRPEAERPLYALYLRCKLELPDMPYTMAGFMRESREHIINDMTDEERPAFLQRMSPEERLQGLPPAERLRGLSAEELRQLEELLRSEDD